MISSWLKVIIIFKLCYETFSCPDRCQCNLDDRGRRQVECNQGHMLSLPLRQIDQSTEIIRISAPDNAPNYLNIGPIFQNLKNLEELHIVGSNVPAIGKHSFWGLPKMKILNLTDNNISIVLDHNFMGMANLVELHLADNKIEGLTSGTFRHLYELRVLNLAGNSISALVPRLFLNLGKLKELDLSGNPLKKLIPEVFRDVQELRAFKCRACELKLINTQIYHLLPQLAILDLGENLFNYIPADEFIELKRLKYLWLDGNKISVVLEKTFIKQNQLIFLQLSNNLIAKVTQTAFTNLTSLHTLDLSYNKLYHLEVETFQPIAYNLKNLNISGNRVSVGEINNVLQTVTQLHTLTMSHLKLTELPVGLFANQIYLRHLNLSYNNFQFFPTHAFSNQLKLAHLDVSSNVLRGFDEKTLIKLSHIQFIHLENNTWSCDLCHIVPMLNKMNDYDYLQKVICQQPPYLHGRKLVTLSKNDLKWCRNSDFTQDLTNFANSIFGNDVHLGVVAIGVCAFVFTCVGIIIVSFLMCSKRHVANYYTHEEKRGPENEIMFDNTAAYFSQNGEISFKFPLDISQQVAITQKKLSISTIDEIKRGDESPLHYHEQHNFSNGK